MVRNPVIEFVEDDVPTAIARKKGGKRGQYVDPRNKPFIAWDSEGQNRLGNGKPQSCVLFGNSRGDKLIDRDTDEGLTTDQICKFLVDCGEKYPGAIHVGYAFTYDFNMIINSLSTSKCRELHEKGFVTWQSRLDWYWYSIRFARGKWLSISRRHADWNRKTNNNARDGIRINDIFGFFTTSFVKAVIKMKGCDYTTKVCGGKCDGSCIPGMAKIVEGKRHRGGSGYCPECKSDVCPFDNLDYVLEYWDTETKLMAEMAEEFRSNLYNVNLEITDWYGPGAIASFLNKKNGTKEHMRVHRRDIQKAARIAYAGGRFERFKIGRIMGPIHAYDLNSAYPYGISQLPSLQGGTWNYVTEPSPTHTNENAFALYHVKMDAMPKFPGTNTPLPAHPAVGPLFYRDVKHNISFPLIVEGWYWAPEVALAMATMPKGTVDILEGWEFTPATDEKPFAWVPEIYKERQILKAAGRPEEYMLKLALNSLYGKQAQRVGWTKDRPRIPPWHQLEWAGWVTSKTRAALGSIIMTIPSKDVIAIETDGVYVTRELPYLPVSKKLGEFSHDVYDEAIYLQSGLAWLRHGECNCELPGGEKCPHWECKRRGLDADTFTLQRVIDYTKNLKPNAEWDPLIGSETRFVGLGPALMSNKGFKRNHRVWRTNPKKKISVGSEGKRIHIPNECRTCKAGLTAYEQRHDTFVRVMQTQMSAEHFIPWAGHDKGDTEPEYAGLQEQENELLGVDYV